MNSPPSTLHPPPSTLHPPPSTLHPPPSTLHPPPSTLHPPPSTLHPPPSTTHTQYLKRILGCNYNTSNIMTRGEIGARPLLVQVIKKVILYTDNVQKPNSSIVSTTLQLEAQNNITPNFCLFIGKFNLDGNNILESKKQLLNKMCTGNYDRYWLGEINHSPKAMSYAMFKTTIYSEKYLILVKNTKDRIALSRLRLSNHNLMIEKGRHLRPRIERNERKCFLYKDEIEDEKHFITKCPLYAQERTLLFQACCQNFISTPSLSYNNDSILS